MQDSVQRPYSVSELTREIKMMLEGAYPEILLEGEISNFKAASSGHWYFNLKDNDAMIQAVMFRGAQRGLSRLPADGQLVRVRGNVSVYAQRGNYQIICSSMEIAGEGQILQMLEECKRRLATEGLFAEELKKPLPLFPATVAVLSAETGAAVRDVIRVLTRRAPWLQVRVVNIPVQGEGAGEKIARALEMCDRIALGEVIILGRGGGSLEDLLAFSDETVVRAVHACRTPVISAVGHEIDWALSDFAADLRAPTPSAAAEMLCAASDELRQRVLGAGRSIAHSFLALRTRLQLALKPFRAEILRDSFSRMLQPKLLALDDARERLNDTMNIYLRGKRQELQLQKRGLEACDPYDVLQRGYTIVRGSDGRVRSSRAETSGDREISIQFRDGSVGAELTSHRNNNGEENNE